MDDGMIAVGSEFGKSLGFTRDEFQGDSYLWKRGDRIIISLITARNPGQGAFPSLVRSIEEAGFQVAVPTPLARMREILVKQGFKPAAMMAGAEIWMRPAAEVEAMRG